MVSDQKAMLFLSLIGLEKGFKTAHPDSKGLVPISFCELRPIGVGQHGGLREKRRFDSLGFIFFVSAMQASDWKSLDAFLVRLNLKQGDVVIKEGDATNAGHILFVARGELEARRNLPNGLQQELGVIQPVKDKGVCMFC